MHTYLLDLLQCPACQGNFNWEIKARSGERIESATAHCRDCEAVYPVQEGIGVFLTPDLPRNDLWEQTDSGLAQYLRAHPDLEHALLDPPLAELAPTDRFFRALLLEERGDYYAAQAAELSANTGLYTSAYLDCWQSQLDYVIATLSGREGPIVDLACGRGYLLEKIARALPNPLIGTDFSPRVLRADRQKLQAFGLYERVSLLAFDARRTPFRSAAIPTLTTNLGLPNIEKPGALLSELRRVVAGVFLAISFFFPPDDAANAAVIQELGLDALLYKANAMERFRQAGWQVELANACRSAAQPTPLGVILAGAQPDSLPAANTELEWGTLSAIPREH